VYKNSVRTKSADDKYIYSASQKPKKSLYNVALLPRSQRNLYSILHIASQKPKNPYPALCNPNAEIPPFDIKLNPDNT
jgi:hypothetical protein